VAGYLIANIDVTDPAKFEEYREKVVPLIEKFGGRYLVRGGDVRRLEGSLPLHRLVVLEFPTLEAAQRFYDSAEYQPILKLRLDSTRSDVCLRRAIPNKPLCAFDESAQKKKTPLATVKRRKRRKPRRLSRSQTSTRVSGAVLVNTPTLERWQLVQMTTVAIACTTGVYALLFGRLRGDEGTSGKIVTRFERNDTRRQKRCAHERNDGN